jgi:hypothetical protein
MDSEYNSLAMAMRDVLPFKNLTRDVIGRLGNSDIQPITFHKTLRTVVHEDNPDTLKLATMEPRQTTPWSKHYGIEYHWFQDKLKPNEVEIIHVGYRFTMGQFLDKKFTSYKV